MKLKQLLFFTLLTCISFSLASCDDDDNKNDKYPKKIKIVEKAAPDCSWITFPENGRYIIINSQEELERHIRCYDEQKKSSKGIEDVINQKEAPKYDFDKYTVLFYCGESTDEISDLTYELVQSADKKYDFNVKIKQSGLETISPWYVAVVVPKIPTDATIAFNSYQE